MAYKLATAFVDIVARGMGTVDRAINGLGSRLLNLASAAASGFGIPLGIGASIAAAYQFIGAATQAYDAEARLRAVIAATGMAAKRSAEDILDMAAAMQKTTVFDDEAIVNAASKLLTFKKVVGETFDRAMKLSADLSAVGFGSIQGAALQLGKALEDPVRGLGALRRAGVTFTEAEKKMIAGLVKSGQLLKAQGIILDAVAGQVAGVAEAMGKTPAGQWQQIKNLIGDVGEEFGKRLLPMAISLGKIVLSWAQGWLKQIDAVIRLGAAIRDQVWAALQPIINWISGATGISFDWLKDGFTAAVTGMIDAWFEFTADVLEWVQVFVQNFGEGMTAISSGFLFTISYMRDLLFQNTNYMWGYFAGRAITAISEAGEYLATVFLGAIETIGNALFTLVSSIPEMIAAGLSGADMGGVIGQIFGDALAHFQYQYGRLSKGFADGLEKNKIDLDMGMSDFTKARKKEFDDVFEKLKKAKDDLEATRGDMWKLPDLGLKMAKPPDDKAETALKLPEGLTGLTQAWSQLQEAMLKRDSPEEKMAKGIEGIEKAADNQLEEAIDMNEKLGRLVAAAENTAVA
jgi:hypothetical protein